MIPDEPPGPTWRALLGAVAIAGAGLAWLGPAGPAAALLVAGLVLATGVLCLGLLGGPRTALVAAITVALWRPVHALDLPGMAAALGLAGILILPSGTRARMAAAGAGAGALVAWAATGSLWATLAALPLGALVPVLRPRSPTRGQLEGVRWVALGLPGVALLVVLAYNGATGALKPGGGPEALALGVGLLGLGWLGALALLGLDTLLASHEPEQEQAWLAIGGLAAGLAVALVAGAWPALVAACVTGAVPVVLLAMVAVSRLATAREAYRPLYLLLPPALALLQWGLG